MKATFTLSVSAITLPDATCPSARAQKCRFCARKARKRGSRRAKADKNAVCVLGRNFGMGLIPVPIVLLRRVARNLLRLWRMRWLGRIWIYESLVCWSASCGVGGLFFADKVDAVAEGDYDILYARVLRYHLVEGVDAHCLRVVGHLCGVAGEDLSAP